MPLGSKLFCAAQEACIFLFFTLPFTTIPEFQKMSPGRGCMGLAWMQLVCAVSTDWEAGAWAGQELVSVWIPKQGLAK